ncbi:MAG: M1 family aminopeptidase [Caldimonas sp.]
MNALTIASFEFRSRLKLVSTWVYFLVFFALALLWIAAAGGLFKDANISFGSGKVAVNSPFALAQTVSILGMFGITVMSAIMGRAVQQDVEYRTQSFFFTAPIGKLEYLGGRFAGALGVLLAVFASLGLGAFVATLLPGMDAERIGPNRWAAYLSPYATVLVPNALLIGAVFFALAATTKKMLPVYVGSVLVLLGWLIALQLVRDADNRTLAALVDPFGSRAVSTLTEYWTIAERNTRLVPLEGVLLWNRLLWLAVAAAISALCFWRFSFAEVATGRPGKRGKTLVDPADAAPEGASRAAPRPMAASALPATPASAWRLVPHRAWLEFRETTKNIYFGVIVLAGLLFLVFASTTVCDIFGTSTWPVTFQMIGLLQGSFAAFMLIIIAFYAGELVWRERDNRLDQISDALPTPTWLPLVSKLVALMLVPAVLQALLMLCGMAIQAAKGYTRFEPGLYLYDLFTIDLLNYWLVCALAIAVHSIVDNKYVGHFVMVVYYALLIFAGQLGLEHNLYKFGAVPDAVYSDMNGYGHFLPRLRAFQAYWGAASLLLLVAAFLFWSRGTPSSWRERLAAARERIGKRTLGLAGASAAAFVALGGFIFYNTNVLNRYQTTSDAQARQVDYEKRYKALAAEAQPKVTAVSLAVDLFPREQRIRVRGNYALQNKTERPVSTLFLNFAPGPALVVHRLELGVPARLVDDAKALGVRRYSLAAPLPPGAATTLEFDLELPTHGFSNSGSNTAVVYNGTFINGMELLPLIGYRERGELERDQDRKKFGLAPKERMRDRDDPAGLMVNGLESDADFIDFEATVSTEPDQIAISPGYLQREWTQGGRRFFHYKMDAPILNFFAFQSARYAVKKDVWHGPAGDVAIEIYHQPGHEFDLDSMDASVKDALAYCSANFGPFQYRQFRIVEFPRYASFAQSFPNTIPFSEAIGFIARVRPDDPKDIDYPYYVTAHEAAHQWWGHQVISGDVQGGSMLVESMAQYSALMVMKHKFGAAKMRRFLSYELNNYLRGRAFEQKKELPLSRVENQPYIHYNKGSLVFYALQDYIGEDRLNQAIRAFRDAHAFKGPPYPSSSELIARIREVTPPELQYVIDDLFEKIVVYDNRAVSATMKPLAGGRWEVTMKVVAKKRVADALGKESDVALDDLIDVGVIDAKGDAIAVERKRITGEESTFTMTVDKLPVKAGIDPLNKLIDRRPSDNAIVVSGG